jgi:two-component system nitrate/nitrite response regulator NarL
MAAGLLDASDVFVASDGAPGRCRNTSTTDHSIKTHIRRLYEKLGVSDRGAAVAQAMRNHLLE